MNSSSLQTDILNIARLSGSFRLRSGQTSNTYFDKYRFEAEPSILKRIAKAMVPLIPAGTECLAGLELGGVPIATALSLESGLPCAFVRKQRKPYGTEKLAEGFDLKGRRTCIIEDVITTGGQVAESADALIRDGVDIVGVCCVILRGDEVPPLLAERNLKVTALIRNAVERDAKR